MQGKDAGLGCKVLLLRLERVQLALQLANLLLGRLPQLFRGRGGRYRLGKKEIKRTKENRTTQKKEQHKRVSPLARNRFPKASLRVPSHTMADPSPYLGHLLSLVVNLGSKRGQLGLSFEFQRLSDIQRHLQLCDFKLGRLLRRSRHGVGPLVGGHPSVRSLANCPCAAVPTPARAERTLCFEASRHASAEACTSA